MENQVENLVELSMKARAMAARVVNGESILQNELNLTPEEMEAMYLVAYNFYNNQKYETAAKCFSMLQMFNPVEYKYCLGTASSYYMLDQLDAAMALYMLGCGIDETRPEAFFHLAECLIRFGYKDDAVEPLKTVIALCHDHPDYTGMKSKAEMMLKGMEKTSA